MEKTIPGPIHMIWGRISSTILLKREKHLASPMDQHLSALGIELPAPAVPRATRIRMHRRVDNQLFVSGQLPGWNGEVRYRGTAGGELDLETAQRAARLSALNVLAQARAALPNGLDDVVSVINLRGYVAVDPSFWQVAEVVNGAPDLMTEVFGEQGAHTDRGRRMHHALQRMRGDRSLI